MSIEPLIALSSLGPDAERIFLTPSEIKHLQSDGRCSCGHLSVFHHYIGGMDACVIDGCKCEM